MKFIKLLFRSAIIISLAMGLSSCYSYSTMEPSYRDNYYNYNSYYDERSGISYTSNSDEY